MERLVALLLYVIVALVLLFVLVKVVEALAG
jgi:hypothetical protein